MHQNAALSQLKHLLTINSPYLPRHNTRLRIGRNICMPENIMFVYGIFPSRLYTNKKTGGSNANTKHKGRGTCCELARE